MPTEISPIELLESALGLHDPGFGVDVLEVLVPEQCLLVELDGVVYHVMITPTGEM